MIIFLGYDLENKTRFKVHFQRLHLSTGKKLVEFDLDWLEITQLFQFLSNTYHYTNKFHTIFLILTAILSNHKQLAGWLLHLLTWTCVIRCSYWQDQTRFFLPSIFIDLFLSFLLLHLFSRDFFFLSFPLFERYGTEMKFSNFSSLTWCVVTLFFIQALQNATFGFSLPPLWSLSLSSAATICCSIFLGGALSDTSFCLHLSQILSFPFPLFERYGTEIKKPDKNTYFPSFLT